VERIHEYRVHVTRMRGETTAVVIYRELESGEVMLVGAEVFGPFETDLEVSQWVWRQLTLDAKRLPR
jgi:hypothetical protein